MFQPAIDPVVGGGGNDGRGDGGGFQGIEERHDARHGAGRGEGAADVHLPRGVELVPVEAASGEFLEVGRG